MWYLIEFSNNLGYDIAFVLKKTEQILLSKFSVHFKLHLYVAGVSYI